MHAGALELTISSRIVPFFESLERARRAWYWRLSNALAHRVPTVSP